MKWITSQEEMIQTDFTESTYWVHGSGYNLWPFSFFISLGHAHSTPHPQLFCSEQLNQI